MKTDKPTNVIDTFIDINHKPQHMAAPLEGYSVL